MIVMNYDTTVLLVWYIHFLLLTCYRSSNSQQRWDDGMPGMGDPDLGYYFEV